MASVSVIIPVYNIAKYLDDCMNSVLSQTFSDLEIILVDDGSTDGVSPGMCDEYAKKDGRVKVIHKENGGLMSAWIAGLVESASNYISFVDSDDWVDTDMIEKLFRNTDSSFAESEIIAGDYIVEKAGERRKETQGLEAGVYMKEALDQVREHILGDEIRPMTMSRCMKLISRKLLLENLKYCDPTIAMGEDVNIMLPCLCDCKRLYIMENAHFYHYRLVSDSISHGYNPKLLSNIELTDKTFREILHDKGIESADRQMDREFVLLLLVVMKNELRYKKPGTLKRVKTIFLRKDIRQKFKDTKVPISGMANRLMYFTAKHPGFLTVSFAKAVINAFDRRTNKSG